MSMSDDGGNAHVRPAYPDEELRRLGEQLAGLYDARDRDPGQAEGLAGEIAAIRSQMRRGPRLQAGEFLADGRYRLIDRSSRAGVWKAWDRDQGLLVFVRVFHGEWVTDEASVLSFLEKGRRLVALDHPGINRVLDVGRSDDGFLFMATWLLDARSLVDAGAIEAIDAVQVLVEVGRALQHAHEHGIAHGDVQPSHVLLSVHGHVALTDFTVAPTDAGGSSLFRAPETTERGAASSPTSDVYGLGMTAMQLLNGGELPFWVLRDPARLIQSLDVADGVKAVLQKSIDWDLSQRYADVASMVADLLADPPLVEALAERSRERGRYSEAAAHYERLLELQPDRAVKIHTVLGQVHTSEGAFDLAFDHLLAALEASPEVDRLFGPLRAVAERTDGWLRLAEVLEQQSGDRDDDNRTTIRVELARIHQHELEDPRGAGKVWALVLRDHRTPAEASQALRALRELAEAQADWAGFVLHSEVLLDYLPEAERAKVEYSIGRAYIEHLHREELGLEFIDRAESHGWTEVDLSTRLQQVRAQMGQWQRVIRLMVLQARSQDIAQASPTLMRAGIIANAVHLEEEAFAVYHALLERAPRHVVALRHLARMHQRAHEHDLAIVYYERLWETYQGKAADEPEASERAADCMAHAQLLLRQGRPDDAAERLEEAMRLAPNHVPSLELAGPLFLGLGQLRRAAQVYECTLSLFKSVELSTHKITACLGMGDLSWVQGRLTAAMGWYNRAIELDPFSVPGWWGLSKVALAARGGHPGAERAPWIKATPKRFTPEEALARLVAGVLSPRSIRAWLQHSAIGRTLVDGGASPMRLACGVVDVMVGHELVSPELFSRLVMACPDWQGPIEDVQQLWFGGAAAAFGVAESYPWSSRSVEADFDATEVRSVLPPQWASPPIVLEDLTGPSTWEVLFADAQPPPPAPFVSPEEVEARKRARYRGPVVAVTRDGVTWGALRRDAGQLTLGRSEDRDIRIPEDPSVMPEHAAIERIGDAVYLVPVEGERVAVNGIERPSSWRLVTGDVFTVGATELDVALLDDAESLPTEVRTPPDVARPDEVAALEAVLAEEVQASRTLLPAPPRDDEDAEVVQPASNGVGAPIHASDAPPPDPLPDDHDDDDAPDDEAPRSEADEGADLAPGAAAPADPHAPPPLPEPASDPAPSQLDTPPPLPGEETVTQGPDVLSDVGAYLAPGPSHRSLHYDDDDTASLDASDVPADPFGGLAGLGASTGEDPDPSDSAADVAGAVPAAGPFFTDFTESDEGAPPDMIAGDDDISHVGGPPRLDNAEPPGWLEDALDAQRDDDLLSPEAAAELEETEPLPGPAQRPQSISEPGAVMGAAVDIPLDEPPPVPAAGPPSSPELDVDPGSLEDLHHGEAWLEFMSGPERGQVVSIGPRLSVGQSDACGMSVPGDSRMSPSHCLVQRTPTGFVLRDAGSTTGTVVNGKKIHELELRGGETIMVGRTVLRFRMEA